MNVLKCCKMQITHVLRSTCRLRYSAFCCFHTCIFLHYSASIDVHTYMPLISFIGKSTMLY